MYKTILKRNTMDKYLINQLLNWEIEEEKFPIFEELINDMKIQNFELFVELDWQCISSMKFLTLDFIRIHFGYLDINILLTNQHFDEDFLIEMIENLLSQSEKDYNIFQILDMIFLKYKNLSVQFRNKYFPTKNLNKIKKSKKEKKIYNVNTSFENIINYIQDNYPNDYENLDMKALSSYKVLSSEFIIRHADKLDFKIIFTHQKIDADSIKSMNLFQEIPLAPLLTANNDLNFDFIRDLDSDLFENKKLNKQIRDKVLKGTLKLCSPERYNHTHWFRKTRKIHDDCIVNHPVYKVYNFDKYRTTFFLDVHPYIIQELS